jgi:hypothetical protein
MRDVNFLQRCVIYVALWLYQLAEDIRESRFVPEGADDPYWQRTMEIMAAPIRQRRLIEESGEHPVVVTGEVVGIPPLPALAAPVVTHTGSVTAVVPMPSLAELEGNTVHLPRMDRPNIRNHRKPDRMKVSIPEATVVASNLDKVVDDVLAALGLTPKEAEDILQQHRQESVVVRVLATV